MKHESPTTWVFQTPRYTYFFLDRNFVTKHIDTSLAVLKGIDDSGALWVDVGLSVKRIDPTDPFSFDESLISGIVRVDPSGAVTTTLFQSDPAIGQLSRLNGVSGTGIAYGWVSTSNVRKYYVGDAEVSFEPEFVNNNGWILGSSFVQKPDGTRDPLPPDGYIDWIDDQNRLIGFYLTLHFQFQYAVFV